MPPHGQQRKAIRWILGSRKRTETGFAGSWWWDYFDSSIACGFYRQFDTRSGFRKCPKSSAGQFAFLGLSLSDLQSHFLDALNPPQRFWAAVPHLTMSEGGNMVNLLSSCSFRRFSGQALQGMRYSLHLRIFSSSLHDIVLTSILIGQASYFLITRYVCG
jgi:hypothetical protein